MPIHSHNLAASRARNAGSTVVDDTPNETDKRRFSQVVIDNRRSLVGYLRRQGASPDQAEDCVQEGLLRAYGALDKLQDWNRARPWLFGIVRYVFLDDLRRRAVRNRIPADQAADALTPTAEALMENSQRSGQLRAAIEELRPPKPEVLELHYGAGLPLDEIAEVMGMPTGTVKTHLRRARAAIRKTLICTEAS